MTSGDRYDTAALALHRLIAAAKAALPGPPRLEGGGQGAVVEIVKLAAQRHPLGKA